MNWIHDLVHQHSELESPLSFWYWSGLTAISAVVKDNIWMDRQIYKLYPNIYVMLHAESGLKKGPPISAAAQLVEKVNNTTIIKGRSSIQGILKEMGTAKTEPGGKIKSNNTIFICSSELTSSIVSDPIATTILTDLYDRHYNIGNWRSLLKMESFNVKAPTVSMLTATNDAHSADFFAHKDVQGGYIARTFVIHESKRNRANSLIWPLRNKPNYEKSAEYLVELGRLQGEFQPFVSETPDEVKYPYERVQEGRVLYFSEAGLIYEHWYKEFIDSVDNSETKDPTGTLNRFGDSVLKVAMLLSLAESMDMVIESRHITEAVKMCETLIGNVRKATLGKVKKAADNTDRKVLAIEELMKLPDHSITRLQLNKKYWMFGNADEWDECMVSLEAAGFITIGAVGNNVVYDMQKNAYDQMKNFMEGKRK